MRSKLKRMADALTRWYLILRNGEPRGMFATNGYMWNWAAKKWVINGDFTLRMLTGGADDKIARIPDDQVAAAAAQLKIPPPPSS